MGWRVRADEEGEIEVREGGVGRASATICAGCSGRCRSLWRQLSAAGPSGGKFWPLQVSLAAIVCCRAVWRRVLAAAGLFGGNCLLQGRCEAVTLAPLLMVLLFRNILSAIFKLCCFSSDSLQVAVSFCVVSNQNRNGTELQFSICMLTRWCC